MGKASVSICIPTLESASAVQATIDSVTRQTHDDLEILVLDNGSTDDTLSIAKGINDERLHIHALDARVSRADHWTEAIERTRGEFVKLVVPGDTLAPACISRQIESLAAPANDRVVVTAVKRTVVDGDGNVLLQSRGLAGMKGRVSSHDVLRKTVRSGTNPLGEPSAVLARGDVFRSCMPWKDDLDYMIDIDMWTRMLDHGDFYAIAETLATVRVPNNAWGGNTAGTQRRQAVDFMKRLQANHPNVISSTDVTLGSTQATLLAQGRRATHWYAERKN